MDFGKNLLKKYGWNEGEGLGKNSDGISRPIQANLKFDKAGLGVDKSAEFNNHWWERVFNDAASNIQVNKSGENVEIATKNKNSVEITTKEYSVKKLEKEKGKDGYNHFLKKSVLNGLREKPDESENSDMEDDIQLSKYKKLTDEELFAACGGRTAHKGARHGLKLTGKLTRIEEQERELLKKMQQQTKEIAEPQSDWKVVITSKKRKREENKVEDDSVLQNILYTNEYHTKSKKKRKKEKQLDNDLSAAFNSVDMGEEMKKDETNIVPDLNNIQKKKRKKKDPTEPYGDVEDSKNIEQCEPEVLVKRQKKKKEKYQNMQEDTNRANFLKSNEPKAFEVSKKKKKKLNKYVKNVVDFETSMSLTCSA